MVRAHSSADGSGQRLLEELLTLDAGENTSVYFEIVTKSLMLSRQRRCRVSTKHPPPPLSGHPSLHLPACVRRVGGERFPFTKLSPLKPYLSCFWTSLKLHTSSSHMPLLFSELWLHFLLVSITPEHNMLPAPSQLLDINQVFGLAKASLAIPPVYTKRTVLKVNVNEIICYVNIFFLCS